MSAMVTALRPGRRLAGVAGVPRAPRPRVRGWYWLARDRAPRSFHTASLTHIPPNRDVSLPKLSRVTQNVLQDPMHDQVGITSDGRSEMCIGGRGQGEVAQVFLRVTRLFQRA